MPGQEAFILQENFLSGILIRISISSLTKKLEKISRSGRGIRLFMRFMKDAVYMHDGDFYQVVKMNLESKIVEAVPFHGNYYTVPGSETNIRIIHRHKKQQWREVNFLSEM